jgi:muramoyltetrapeptide carboxypeptidase
MNPNVPKFLAPGDEVAIVALSKQTDFSNIDPAIQILENWGFKVSLAKNLFVPSHNTFAGPDNERLESLQQMIDNRNIKAIICSRGGYGLTRIIDQIDLTSLIEYPKWIVGFSDISVLLNLAVKNNVPAVHGIMAFQFKDDKYKPSLDSLKKVLLGQPYSIEVRPHSLNIHGTAKAPVVGGNLTMLINTLGTPSEFDTSGKILLIEEVEEYLYKIDRMMVHLKRGGKLNGLAGVIVGYMTKMLDNDIPFGKDANEIIRDHVHDMNIPVCFGFPSGHEADNLAVPFGIDVFLEVSTEKTVLSIIS